MLNVKLVTPFETRSVMPKATSMMLKASQMMGRPITWAQVQLDALEDLQGLMRRAPKAAELIVVLISRLQPGSGGVVVASRETLRELLDCSMPTVERALRLLISEGWVQRMRIGSAHALAINERVAWVGPRQDLQHAVFSATVIASRSEQDAAALNPPPARRVPMVEPGERVLPAGPGLKPPSQPELPGVDFVAPVRGAVRRGEPSEVRSQLKQLKLPAHDPETGEIIE